MKMFISTIICFKLDFVSYRVHIRPRVYKMLSYKSKDVQTNIRQTLNAVTGIAVHRYIRFIIDKD